jgi:hypothetical protein
MKNIPIPFVLIVTYTLTAVYLSTRVHPLFGLMFIVPIIMRFIDGITSSSNGNTLTTRTIFFLLTGRIKRVKTSFGRFYVTNRQNDSDKTVIELYECRTFYLKEIGFHHFENTQSMKAWIKVIYDKKYADREAVKAKVSEIKKWNGYIDVQHERDSKINEVIK